MIRLRLSIRSKLISLVLLSITLVLFFTGIAIDYFLKSIHTKSAAVATNRTFQLLYTDLKKTEASLNREGLVFVKRPEIVSSANMISRYQDKTDYNPMIFDTEKKKLADELMKMSKLSLSDYGAVYGTNGELECFSWIESGVYYRGIVSFDAMGERVVYQIGENDTVWTKSKVPSHFRAEIKRIKVRENYILNSGEISYRNNTDSFTLRYFRTISRKYANGKIETAGYLSLAKRFDRTYLDEFSGKSESYLSFSVDGKHIIGMLRGIKIDQGILSAHLLTKEDIGRHDFRLDETPEYFVHAHVVPAENGKIYFISGFSKEKLNFELNETRKYLLAILLITALLVAPVTLVVMRQSVFDPLRRLVDAVESIKAGEYRPVESFKTNDELALLFRSFNEMAYTIKHREEELRSSEQNLKEAQQIAKVGSWRMDLANERVEWSDEMFRLYDIKPGSIPLTRQTFLDFVHPDEREEITKMMESTMASRQPREIEYRIVTASGETKIFSSKAQPVFDEKGGVSAFVGVNHDITDIKKAQHELEEYKNQLEVTVSQEIAKRMEQEQILIQQSKLAAMGEMIGNIAHQWRQPLNTLGLQIQDIADAYDFGELDKAYLEKSVKDSMRVIEKMSNTINDFKDFFKPDKKKVDFTVSEALDDAIPIIAASLKNNFIEINVDIRQDSVIHGFLNEYSQVLLNIINNAKDALKKIDNPKKLIHIEVDRDEEGRSQVRISDNGGGIPEDIVEKVFDPYFTTKHKAEGTGIGLYMSKMIIERNMQGQLSARNSDGGALFTITV